MLIVQSKTLCVLTATSLFCLCVSIAGAEDAPNEEDQWFDALGGSTQQAARALQGFERRGPSLFDALARRWPRLPEPSKRRVMPYLERLANHVPGVHPLLTVAANDDDSSLGLRALRSLTRNLPQSRPHVLPLLKNPAHLHAVSLALAASNPAATLTTLLQPRWVDRPEVRPALQRIAKAAPEQTISQLDRWLTTEPSTHSVVSIAYALRETLGIRSTLKALLMKGIEDTKAEDFESRWRIAKASTQVADEPVMVRWLTTAADQKEPWMLRSAAIETLGGQVATQSVALEALSDSAPRVRVAAAKSLQPKGEILEVLAKSARIDPWPMVRQAALSTLASEARALPILRAAVDDPSHRVRSDAIRLLAEQPDAAAWPSVHARLKNDEEWPDVRLAAIDYALKQCVLRAAPTLEALVDTAAAQSASPEQKDIGVQALRALRRLGVGDAIAKKLSGGGKGPLFRMASKPLEPSQCTKIRGKIENR